VKLDPIRKHALSLEAVTEEAHHHYSSFRVRGKIFVTVPPEEDFIHVFVSEEDRQRALALYPELWGTKVLGLRVALASANAAVVKSLVSKAYETRVKRDAGAKTAAPRSRRAKA
jgi:capsular polysaccharide biosynthesis protein